MNTMKSERRTLLLVDDEPANLQVLRHTLQDDYRLLFAKDGVNALEIACDVHPDLILLDIMMPGLSGYDVCRSLKRDAITTAIPVLFVTALSDAADEETGFALGAADYITKPFSPAIVKARIRTHLALVQTEALRRTRLQVVQCLSTAAEYKDNETGMHVIRMSHYARTLALAAGYSEEAADDLLHAAPMHDVGKIGIPDAILRKAGRLTPEEWEVMKGHAEIGGRIIGTNGVGLLATARVIALNHHEKWDGSGYPQGLAGQDIPHAARIVAIADVFDALTSRRPYKPAWSIQDAIELIREESGRHFDPELVEHFIRCLPEILEIKERWADRDDAPAVVAVQADSNRQSEST